MMNRDVCFEGPQAQYPAQLTPRFPRPPSAKSEMHAILLDKFDRCIRLCTCMQIELSTFVDIESGSFVIKVLTSKAIDQITECIGRRFPEI